MSEKRYLELLPDLDCCIGTGGCNRSSVWCPGDSIDLSAMARIDIDQIERGRIAGLDDAIGGGQCQLFAIGGKSNSCNTEVATILQIIRLLWN